MEPQKNIKVFHVLPSLAVGGVETLVTRFMSECPLELDYRLIILNTEDTTRMPLSPSLQSKIEYAGSSKSPFTYLRAAAKIVTHRDSVIVSSTWRGAIAVWLATIFVSISRHIAFTHRSSAAHWVDQIVRTWQVKHSILNIADSESSAQWVKRTTQKSNIQVVDPLFDPAPMKIMKSDKLAICFIGRLAPVKNLETICKLIDYFAETQLSFVFHVYGPDAGCMRQVTDWIASHRVGYANAGQEIEYIGVISPNDVHKTASRYHFIISCSHTEGFAMSIAEAMQVGTVPIVGKVGGPASYCRKGNSIILDDYTDKSLKKTSQRILNLWMNPSQFQSFSKAAKSTFKKNNLFTENYIKIIKLVANRKGV